MIHEGSAGKTDVVAHFFRRTFSLLRERSLGLIATNTIAQGILALPDWVGYALTGRSTR